MSPHNEAWRQLDAVEHLSVKSRNRAEALEHLSVEMAISWLRLLPGHGQEKAVQ